MPRNNITHYKNLTALVDHVRELPYREGWRGGGRSDNEWHGGTWEQTFKLVEYGWPEGSQQASKMSVSIADRAIQGTSSALVPEIVYDVTGAAYDPGAYMAGVPECWLAFQPHEEKRAIRMVVNIAVSCAVSVEVFRRRGIALSALALALNAQGHPITVDVVQAIKPRRGMFGDPKDYETIMFRAADALSGSPLDIDRMVYSMAHPSVFRRICSAATNGFRGKTEGTHWGCSAVPMIGEPIPDLGQYDLFLGAGHIYDVERWNDGGEEWVLQEYLKQTSA